jgi:2-(1,2-epoxy-1,2-dihydrophenyl)acetyl-CoA isomerase
MAYENLTLEKTDDGVAIVTLNRPEKLNALSRELQRDLLDVCEEARTDDAVRAVIFTGAGRGFCSGADLTGGPREAAEPRRLDLVDEFSWVGRQAKAIYGLDKPTIAAVNGVAAGAGMSLSLACDVRVGTSRSRFKTVFIERNLSPDAGMTYFLPRIVGAGRAYDLAMTSRTVEGVEAFRLGLLDRFVDDEHLMEEAVALARVFAAGPPIALTMTKRALQHSLDATFEEQLRFEVHAISHARRAAHDSQEAGLSFREKRKAVFTGR